MKSGSIGLMAALCVFTAFFISCSDGGGTVDGGVQCGLGGFKCTGNKAYNCGPDNRWIITDCSALLGMECYTDQAGAGCRPTVSTDGGTDAGVQCGTGGFMCQGNRAYNCGPDNRWIITDCSALVGTECFSDQTGAKCRPISSPDAGFDGGVAVGAVQIPEGQTVDVGATKALAVNAWDKNGNKLDVGGYSVAWGVAEGEEFIKFAGGSAVGLAHGQAAVFAVVGGIASPAQNVKVTVVPAGQLIPLCDGASGNDNGLASAISGDGNVVVGSCTVGGKVQGYWWKKGGTPQGIGRLEGYDQCYANAVNHDGSVIVGYCVDGSYNNHAFVWTTAGGISELDGFPIIVTSSTAYGVSADRKRIVGSCHQGNNIGQGFLWEEGKDSVTLFNDLNTFGQYHHMIIRAISPDGTRFAGEIGIRDSKLGDALYEAFTARQMGDIWELTVLVNPIEDLVSSAYAMNSDGTFIVGDTFKNGPFEWSQERGMVLMTPDREVTAYAVSEDGTFAAGGSGSPGYAFFWDWKLGYTNLLDFLKWNGMFAGQLENCSPVAVWGISTDGQVLVGGCRTGISRGFYLELPR
jgi:probable HAF family extracellular repeat protein